MGFTWAAAWSAAGLVPRWVFGLKTDAPFPIIFGVLGFMAGVTFSGLVMLTAGRRRFDQMSLPRFAGWGAFGGLLLATVVRWAAGPDGEILVLAPVFAAAGAISAAGTLALARRAGKQELLDGDVEVAEHRIR